MGAIPDRSDFLRALGALAATPGALGAAGTTFGSAPRKHALVLSGGGALGSYEAGIVGCLAATAGINDGSPLAPYDIVFGTSIGALNGWLVATGQYTRLRELWYGVSAANLLQLKPEFAASENPRSGLFDQLAAKVRMASLTTDQVALYDSTPVFDFITRNIDPERPPVTSLVWAVTNLTRHRTEFFYRRSHDAPEELPQRIVRAIQLVLGEDTVVREAAIEHFHHQLFASAALPVIWDPVLLESPEGTIDQYCDGGVLSNASVRIAHVMANAADVVLLYPQLEADPHYKNAVEVVIGMITTMQQKILTSDMRTTQFQSVGRRVFETLPSSAIAAVIENDPELAIFLESSPVTDMRFIRPKELLPLSAEDFDNEKGIGEAYRTGWNDIIAGFTPYDWKTFEA